MKSTKTKNSKNKFAQKQQLVMLVSAVVALLLVILMGAYHTSIAQKYDRVRYGYDARRAFSEEVSTLGEPIAAFGVRKGAPSKCATEAIYQYAEPQLQCSVYENPYTVIGSSHAAKVRFAQLAGELDSLFKQNGWTETQNTTPTVKQWFQGITSGKDWYADEGAFKNIDNSHCSIDFFLAFANPHPPAFTIQTSCTSPILSKYKYQL